MKRTLAWAGLTIVLLSGCSAIQTSGAVQAGRQALYAGRPEEALGYFRHAAELNPDYVTGFTLFTEGVWSYVGRAAYEIKDYDQARRALETAITRHPDDSMGHLYLGLTLGRSGDRQRALSEIQTGLRGIYDWLESTASLHRYDYGRFWDPTQEIRSDIRNVLAMSSKEGFGWPNLIEAGERIGNRMENEIDRALQEERFFRGRQGDNQGGGRN